MSRNEQDRPVVVVTGASAGIGRATACAFAKRGASLGLIARGEAGLAGARTDVESVGGRAIVCQADVSDGGALEDAADHIERELGPIDVWVNDAMVSVFSPAIEMTSEEYKRVTDVSYLGYVNGTLTALKRMVPRDHGSIVQVGSALAYRGIPLQSAYCGAKHAIQGFTESVRCELLHDKSNVRLTMVQMPAVNTPQFGWVRSRLRHQAKPVPPIYQPEVAAEAIVWAASHDRREVDVGLSTVIAIWGNKFFAGFADKYLARTGYSSQQTNELRDTNRPDNLWDPVDSAKDFGAHGRFDSRSSDRSLQLDVDLHRGQLALAGMGLVAGAAGVLLDRRGRRP